MTEQRFDESETDAKRRARLRRQRNLRWVAIMRIAGLIYTPPPMPALPPPPPGVEMDPHRTRRGGQGGSREAELAAQPEARAMERLGQLAAATPNDAEAEAFVGALPMLAATLVPPAAPALLRCTPQMVRGLSTAAKILRESPETRGLVRQLPSVARDTALRIGIQGAQHHPVPPDTCARILAHATIQVLRDATLTPQPCTDSLSLRPPTAKPALPSVPAGPNTESDVTPGMNTHKLIRSKTKGPHSQLPVAGLRSPNKRPQQMLHQSIRHREGPGPVRRINDLDLGHQQPIRNSGKHGSQPKPTQSPRTNANPDPKARGRGRQHARTGQRSSTPSRERITQILKENKVAPTEQNIDHYRKFLAVYNDARGRGNVEISKLEGFEKYAVKDINIGHLRGSRAADFAEADRRTGYTAARRRAEGLVWHHHPELGRMVLIPKDIHALDHHGGVSIWQAMTRRKYK